MFTPTNKFELKKFRANWLKNWLRVFQLWRWSPGFWYIAEFNNYIPIFFSRKKKIVFPLFFSNPKLTSTQANQVSKDTLDAYQSEKFLFNVGSPKDRKKLRFLNPFYLRKAFNVDSHPFLNGKYVWQSSLYNANQVVEKAFQYKSTYDLLINNLFLSDLNLHKSANSLVAQNSDYTEDDISIYDIQESDFFKLNKTQKQYFSELEMASWGYDEFVVSAICFVLGSVYREAKLKGEICPILLISEFTRVNKYLLCPLCSEQLYNFLEHINLFGYDPFLGLKNSKYFFETINERVSKLHDDTNKSNKLLFLNKSVIKYCKLFKLSFLTPDLFFQGIIDNMPLKLTQPKDLDFYDWCEGRGTTNFSKENIRKVEKNEIQVTFLPVFHVYEKFLKLCTAWCHDQYSLPYGYFLDDSYLDNTYHKQLEFISPNSKLFVPINKLSFRSNFDEKFKTLYNNIIFVIVFLKNYYLVFEILEKTEIETSTLDADDLIEEYFWLETQLTNIFPSLNIDNLFRTPIHKIYDLFIKYRSYDSFKIIQSKVETLLQINPSCSDIFSSLKFGLFFLVPRAYPGFARNLEAPKPQAIVHSPEISGRNISQKKFNLSEFSRSSRSSSRLLVVSQSVPKPKNAPLIETDLFEISRQTTCTFIKKHHANRFTTSRDGITTIFTDLGTGQDCLVTTSGSYDTLKQIKNSASKEGLHVAHTHPKKIRENFGVKHGEASAVFWSQPLNALEEKAETATPSRDFTYTRELEKNFKTVFNTKNQLKLQEIKYQAKDKDVLPAARIDCEIEAMRQSLDPANQQLFFRSQTLQVPEKKLFLSEVLVYNPIIRLNDISEALETWISLDGQQQTVKAIEVIIPDSCNSVVSSLIIHCRANIDLKSHSRLASTQYALEMDVATAKYCLTVLKIINHQKHLLEIGGVSFFKIPPFTVGQTSIPALTETTDQFLWSNCLKNTIIQEANQSALGLTQEDLYLTSKKLGVGNFSKQSKHTLLQTSKLKKCEKLSLSGDFLSKNKNNRPTTAFSISVENSITSTDSPWVM